MNPKLLLGKRVVAVEMNPFRAREGDKTVAHRPTIFFEDGSCISFIAEETDFDDYGVNVLYTPKARRPNASAVRL